MIETNFRFHSVHYVNKLLTLNTSFEVARALNLPKLRPASCGDC